MEPPTSPTTQVFILYAFMGAGSLFFLFYCGCAYYAAVTAFRSILKPSVAMLVARYPVRCLRKDASGVRFGENGVMTVRLSEDVVLGPRPAGADGDTSPMSKGLRQRLTKEFEDITTARWIKDLENLIAAALSGAGGAGGAGGT